MKLPILKSETLAKVWIALLGSGYDLYDKRIPWLEAFSQNCCSLLHGQEAISAFFAQARTDEVAVNPWWPRASCLSRASFFLNESLHLDLEAYLAFEAGSAALQAWQDPDFVQWIERFPSALSQVLQLDGLPALLAELQSETAKRLPDFQKDLEKAASVICRFNGSEQPRQLAFMPNLLQAPQLTDYVQQETRLIVIANQPDLASMVHEWLHPVVKEQLSKLDPAEHHRVSAYLDQEKLKALGYFWEKNEAGFMRALEETIVRNLSLAISGASLKEKLQGALDLEVSGFFTKADLLLYPEGYWNRQNLAQFIKALFK